MAAASRWLTYAPSNSAYTYYYVTVTTNTSSPTVTGYGWSRLPPAYGGNNWQWINRIVEDHHHQWWPFPPRHDCQGLHRHERQQLSARTATTLPTSLYSTNGRYDPTKIKQNGDIASNLTITNAIDIGNANIKGSVATGPGGSVALGPSGYITGTVTHDMNLDFPQVAAPFAAAPGLQPGSGGYTYTVPAGNTLVNSLSLSGNNKILVTGDAKLYVTGNVSLTGNAFIELGTNASLEIYVGGASASFGGNGILNNTGTALKLSYFGLPSNTSVSVSGNGDFTGTIYAPNANFTGNGGGHNIQDFSGAMVVNNITLNGHFNLHYDEAIGPNCSLARTSRSPPGRNSEPLRPALGVHPSGCHKETRAP